MDFDPCLAPPQISLDSLQAKWPNSSKRSCVEDPGSGQVDCPIIRRAGVPAAAVGAICLYRGE